MTAKAHSRSESLSPRFLTGPVFLQQRALWHVFWTGGCAFLFRRREWGSAFTPLRQLFLEGKD